MPDLPLEQLWEWWRELASRELVLEAQFKPLIDEHNAVHAKRMALENLMAQGRLPAIQQEISSAWGSLREGAQMPSTERKPPDVAFDVLSRRGAPMHYRELLEEMKKDGAVIGGRDPGTTLVAYLGRDKRFSKAQEVGRGYWQLKESQK